MTIAVAAPSGIPLRSSAATKGRNREASKMASASGNTTTNNRAAAQITTAAAAAITNQRPKNTAAARSVESVPDESPP